MPALRIFISYSRADSAQAEALATRLAAEGHEVFWDQDSLPPGEAYDDRLLAAIQRCELFVCLIGEHSFDEGRYARTELKFAQQRWPNPSGRVLPVLLHPPAMASLPAYLKSVTVATIEGDMVAEVVGLVQEIARRPLRRLALGARVVAGVLGLAAAGWASYALWIQDRVELSVAMSGQNYTPTVDGRQQRLAASTGYVQLFGRALAGQEHADGEQLYTLYTEDQSAVASVPLIHFRIANKTGSAIVADRLRLRVKESRIDREPLLWSHSRDVPSTCILNAGFALGNQGWGAARQVRFDFDLRAGNSPESAQGRCPSGTGPGRCFSQALPDVESGKRVRPTIWDALAQLEPRAAAALRDTQWMPDDQAPFAAQRARLLAAIAPQAADGQLYAVGELSYQTEAGETRRLSLRQEVPIILQYGCVSPLMVASAVYDIELRPEGRDYEVEVPIGHSVDAGQTEAIDLAVWVEKGSLHDMTAAVRVGERWIEAGDRLDLAYYLPVGHHASPQRRNAGTP
jgi:TIR domain